MGKLCNFPSKNRLKTQETGNCATQGVLQHSQGASQESSLCHLEGYCEPMSRGKVVNFFLVGNHPLGETNFPFDIGS